MTHPRPHVSANLAMSADGKIAAAQANVGRFTSPADRAHMDHVRHDTDAVLMGAHTLRQANPDCTVKNAKAVAARKSAGFVRQPLAVVVCASGVLPDDARIFRAAAKSPAALEPAPTPVVFTTAAAQLQLQVQLGPRAAVVGLGHAPLDAAAMLHQLYLRGVRRLLIEGGGETLWAFAAAGALDVLHVTLAPCLIGGSQAPTLLGGPGFALHDRLRLALTSSTVVGDEIFVSYRVLAAQA